MKKLIPLFLSLLAASSLLPAADRAFTIAALRVTPERWDKEGNYRKLEQWARKAAEQGAQLVVTPEGFLEGYVVNTSANPGITEERYRAVAEPLDGAVMNRIRSLARELKIHLLVGFAESRDGRMFNSAVLFSPQGEALLHYSKSHNAHDEPFNTVGAEFPVAQTGLGTLGALICYDRQLPETSRILAIKGAQMILVPAWGSHGEMNEVMMRTRAYENAVYVAFVHPHCVLIIDPKGSVVARDQGDVDQIVTARIEFDGKVGRGPIRDRRPDIYGELLTPPKR
ncbi:MAG: carbon-nitrogen hydrolase family protein [Acidobacteria bacterium]|nr:carbon-nitrogen hydrolase family protein [Acidobacteriota bacterium]